MSLDSNFYIKTLIDAGADAMSNLYYVEFELGNDAETKVGTNLGLTVRSGEFTPPAAFTQSVDNEIHFLTSSLTVPTAQYTGDRSFDISFRLDENYKVYSYLKALQGKTSNAGTGFAGMFIPGELDNNKSSFDVKVYAFKAKSNPDYMPDNDYLGGNKILMYHFQKCWISKLTGIDYSYDSPGPLSITASFGCQYYSGPGSDKKLENSDVGNKEFYKGLGDEGLGDEE